MLRAAAVQRLTLTRNAGFLADREETAIASGGLRQARVLRFNPDISASVPGTGIGGSRNPLEATLMQELEIGGQRGLRISAARAGVTRAGASVRNSARLAVAEATRAFYQALSAERRLAVTQDGVVLITRLLDAVRTQVREGEISTLEGTLAEIEFGRARGRVLEAERIAVASVLELKRLVGIQPDVPVRLEDSSAPQQRPVGASNYDPVGAHRLVPDVDSASGVTVMPRPASALPDPGALRVDSLLNLAVAQRPDLAALVAATRELEGFVSLARREALPNLRIGVLAERIPDERGLRLGPAAGVSLPLWNRNQGLIAQRRAQVRQAQLARESVELRVRTDVEAAVRTYRTATQEANTFEAMVREPARVNSALLETAFRAGKIALPTLLLLRNQLLDAELGFWDAWLARQTALVQLDAATGTLARDAFTASEALTTPNGTSP